MTSLKNLIFVSFHQLPVTIYDSNLSHDHG